MRGPRFSPGDRVEVIDARPAAWHEPNGIPLTLGDVFTVIEFERAMPFGWSFPRASIVIRATQGMVKNWDAYRFRKLPDASAFDFRAAMRSLGKPTTPAEQLLNQVADRDGATDPVSPFHDVKGLNQARREGAAWGFPDVMCLWEGGVAFIEFKAAKGKIAEHQAEWLDQLSAMGFAATVSRDPEHALAFLKDAGAPVQ